MLRFLLLMALCFGVNALVCDPSDYLCVLSRRAALASLPLVAGVRALKREEEEGHFDEI